MSASRLTAAVRSGARNGRFPRWRRLCGLALSTLIVAIVLSSSAAARDRRDFVETYAFMEQWLGPGGVNSGFVWYLLRCDRGGTCELSISGYQIDVVFLLRAARSGHVTKFAFTGVLGDGSTYGMERGDVVFEFHRRKSGRIITIWKAWRPYVEENAVPGTRFVRER